MEQTINIKLKIWRQRGPKEPGQFVDYSLDNVRQRLPRGNLRYVLALHQR